MNRGIYFLQINIVGQYLRLIPPLKTHHGLFGMGRIYPRPRGLVIVSASLLVGTAHPSDLSVLSFYHSIANPVSSKIGRR